VEYLLQPFYHINSALLPYAYAYNRFQHLRGESVAFLVESSENELAHPSWNCAVRCLSHTCYASVSTAL